MQIAELENEPRDTALHFHMQCILV